jgi:hypothetical protein
MIEQLFQRTRAPFIVVRDGQLHVDGCAYTQLTVQIHDVLPVRKLFRDRTLQCYSLDCEKGNNGRFCELCPERRGCGRRLQLRLVYRDRDENDHPAILEITPPSFPAFERCCEQLGDINEWTDLLLLIKTVRTENGWTKLRFKPLF